MPPKSFRTKMLISGIILTVMSLSLIAFNTRYFQKKDELLSVGHIVKNIETDVLKIINRQNLFFNHDRTNSKYFKSGSSDNLKSVHALVDQVNKEVLQLNYRARENDFGLSSEINQVQSYINALHLHFQHTVDAVYARGYMDYGYEGKMRSHIHRLENLESLDKELLLSLRRHEKDYIIRQDSVYIDKLASVSEQFEASILESSLNEQKKALAIQDLNRYNFYFQKIITANQLINNGKNGGLRGQLNAINAKLLSHLEEVKAEVNSKSQTLFLKYRNTYGLVFILALIIQLCLSIYVANRLTKPLVHLTSYIEKYVSNGFKKTESLNLKSRKDEFGKLGANFNLLEKELEQYVGHFKEMVEERTVQLSDQNEALLRSKTLIQTQNKDLLDNITYAKRIQNALLPSKADLTHVFPDHCLIYQPKDIVSGDFYWIHQTADYLYFAVGDCTGHGVTGAFMSLLGISTLNEIVKRKKTVLPNEILMSLNRKISDVTRKSEEVGVHDGMDIAMCMINRETNQLYFSGAGRPLLLHQQNTITEVKGDKRSISGYTADTNFLYEQHQFSLDEITTVYLYTDGIVDQFGGNLGKKFKKSRLVRTLDLIKNQSIVQQEIHFKNLFENWMMNEPQVDDCCLIGLDMHPIHWPTRQFNRELHSLMHQ